MISRRICRCCSLWCLLSHSPCVVIGRACDMVTFCRLKGAPEGGAHCLSPRSQVVAGPERSEEPCALNPGLPESGRPMLQKKFYAGPSGASLRWIKARRCVTSDAGMRIPKFHTRITRRPNRKPAHALIGFPEGDRPMNIVEEFRLLRFAVSGHSPNDFLETRSV
jgi:hypothetical protein